jgi:hypothetical protein
MSVSSTIEGTTKKIQIHCSDEDKEEELYRFYLTSYGVIMRRFICENVIPAQHELFRLNRINRCEEGNGDVAYKQKMIKYFEIYTGCLPNLTHLDFDVSECPIVRNMSKWVDDFVVDVREFIKKDLMLNFIARENGELHINANVKKIKDFCLTYIQSEMEGKYEPMADLIHEYIYKHESIVDVRRQAMADLMRNNDVVVEEKVVPKSKSQLKKEKAREANKRREQEKADKLKRQEKEAKYLEQKRKEAEKKRIAVCRAKNRK